MYSLRRSVIDDFGWWFETRNRADAVAVSGSQKELTRDEALAKFTMQRDPGAGVFWIIEPDAGWIVMEWEENWGTISIYIKPHARGHGLGSKVIEHMRMYVEEELDVTELWAHVREENIRSSGVFTKCGFELESTGEGMWNFVWRKGE